MTSFTEVVTTMQRREERGKKAELQRGKVNFCPVNQWASEGEGGVVIRDSRIGLQCSKGLARSLASDLVPLVCEAPDTVTEGWLVIGPPINPHDRIIRYKRQQKCPLSPRDSDTHN